MEDLWHSLSYITMWNIWKTRRVQAFDGVIVQGGEAVNQIWQKVNMMRLKGHKRSFRDNTMHLFLRRKDPLFLFALWLP